ncbi:ABC transporter permease [Actinocrinis puniceicyclus]|uniref:ABC transporter permease n=1 Tax=Actinocrinis puniceicyclus TaxID=977794 RepID=A0A8J7WMN3_9ACTN|nr:ABC transporter permease [Actinocrinis puniceicyclus]MBS2965188.1 ABC transporter permease [Actinocrinis puniceicyclus]
MTALLPGTAATWSGVARRIAQAEWIKLRTLRSTAAILSFACVLTAGFAALIANGNTSRTGTQFDPVNMCMSGLIFGQYLFAAFGALVMTSEYGSGTIRATLAATPRRAAMLIGKAIALAAAAAMSAVLTVAGSVALCELFFFHHAPRAALTSGPAVRALVSAVAILVIAALTGLALGAIFRSTAGALIGLAVLFFLALPLVTQLPTGTVRAWSEWLLPWISTAWAVRTVPMTSYAVAHNAPGPVTGLLAFGAEAFVLLAVSAVLLIRRDA